MTPLDIPLDEVPADKLLDHLRQLKEYIRDCANPNEISQSGMTCLSVALALYTDEGGERLVKTLLERGADPNIPTPLANFRVYIAASSNVLLLDQLIKVGMRLNDRYEDGENILPTGRKGSFTLLDFVLDIEKYLSKRVKSALVEKNVGSLVGRRRFIADVIARLESSRARVA